jgi:recombination protein RecT
VAAIHPGAAHDVSATTDIKQALEVRADRATIPAIYETLELHEASLARKIPTGVLTWPYAKEALLTELRRNEKLREADPRKVLGAFAYGLQLGLIPGPLGLVHFVPFGQDVVFLVGYRGYIELAYRSGLVKDVSAELVYEGDRFIVSGGTRPGIVHEMQPPGERDVTAAYAVAHLKSGGTVFRVIYEPDWERARKSSQLGAKGKGPWADDRAAMVRKTALRRLEPLLPKGPEIGVAVSLDEQPAVSVDEVAPLVEATDE